MHDRRSIKIQNQGQTSALSAEVIFANKISVGPIVRQLALIRLAKQPAIVGGRTGVKVSPVRALTQPATTGRLGLVFDLGLGCRIVLPMDLDESFVLVQAGFELVIICDRARVGIAKIGGLD